MADRHALEMAIAAQESLRGSVSDEVIDAAIAALRKQLTERDEQRRRQVTVLFADVSGFTALSERLDPEVLANLMNHLWSLLDAAILEHGGHIDKHMGDAVMAVWGVHGTREDDPERAVRAALQLQEQLGRFRAESASEVTMRVGVNTGPVLLGAVGTTAEVTVMGDVVNVASRLEHAAPVGGVLISHDTYRHVRGVFDVDALEPLAVRGKTEAVQAYVVERAKPRAFRIPSRGVEGIETRTIGRDVELGMMQAQFEAARAGDGARVVVVSGEAGVGKSRLLWELQNWLELRPERVWFLTGRALPLRRGMALALVRDVLTDRFGVLDSDQVAEVTAKFRSGLAITLNANEADLVAQWLGVDVAVAPGRAFEAEQLDVVARAHLVRWLGQLAGVEPVVLLLEDLHWADDESLAVVADVVARLPQAHLLVVGLTRPELRERNAAWFDGSLPGTAIDLPPLSADETRRLAAEILQRVDQVPGRLIDLIVDRADGNAFYVEELVRMFTDGGAIRVDDAGERWHVDSRHLDAIGVPPTLTGVLQARLDALDPPERSTLQHAAVVGRVFWDETVASMQDHRASAVAALDVARRRELVFHRDHSAFDASEEYIFKHALLRDVVYETVLLRDRRQLHSKVAAWLTQRSGDRLGEYLDMIAEHHRLAGNAAAAAECSHRAARAAMDRGQYVAARRSWERAIELWDEAGERIAFDTLVSLAEARLRVGELDAAEDAVTKALGNATTAAERARALYIGTQIAFERGDQAEERRILDELARLDHGDVASLARAQIGLAWWELRYGDLDAAAGHADRARSLADHAGLAIESIGALAVAGAIAMERDDLVTMEEVSVAAIALARRSGNRAKEAIAEAHLGVVYHLRGDATGDRLAYRDAVVHYERGLAIRRDLGDQFSWATERLNLAQVFVRLGDIAEARIAVREALMEAASVGATRVMVFALLVEADRRITSGEADRGLSLLGLVRARPAADRADQLEIERILSRVTMEPARIEAGLEAGAALDFDEVVSRLLREGEAD
jgi:class 3 adenylate cyclase/tetratricopeptide (TPR) repeat protein